MCGSRYQLDLVEELAISQLNIAFRIAPRVVKFLDLVLLAVPKVVRAKKVADDGMKITSWCHPAAAVPRPIRRRSAAHPAT
jgi:hypothetical protein